MSDYLKNGLRTFSRASKRTLRRATSESSMRSLRYGLRATRQHSTDTIQTVAQAPITRKVASTASFVISSGPAAELAKICGRAGVAGAVVDGAIGGMHGYKAMQEGKIDGKQVLLHTGAEAGCGFVTSSSGTAGTIAAYMITGSMGPAALVCGMGASLGSRYVYRKIVGETLPQNEGTAQESKNPGDDTEDSNMEEIGPKKRD